jgi:hypothetical protein
MGQSTACSAWAALVCCVLISAVSAAYDPSLIVANIDTGEEQANATSHIYASSTAQPYDCELLLQQRCCSCAVPQVAAVGVADNARATQHVRWQCHTQRSMCVSVELLTCLCLLLPLLCRLPHPDCPVPPRAVFNSQSYLNLCTTASQNPQARMRGSGNLTGCLCA